MADLPRCLGLGNSSSVGRGKGKPFTIATQNTCGSSAEKLVYCANSGFDVYALTEFHGNFSDSRVAADLGKRLIT